MLSGILKFSSRQIEPAPYETTSIVENSGRRIARDRARHGCDSKRTCSKGRGDVGGGGGGGLVET